MKKILVLIVLSLTLTFINCSDPETPNTRETETVFSVVLRAEGGTPIFKTVTVKYGEPMPSTTAPTRLGYTFLGFYTGMNGTGTKYYNSDMSSARNWDQTADDTLYAKWRIDN